MPVVTSYARYNWGYGTANFDPEPKYARENRGLLEATGSQWEQETKQAWQGPKKKKTKSNAVKPIEATVQERQRRDAAKRLARRR